MIDDAGEEIKAVEDCFSDSSIMLCHHVLRSWCKKLGYKHGKTVYSHKKIVWKDLLQQMKTEGWNNMEAQEQVINIINKWQNMDIKSINDFANYFEQWKKPKYAMKG